MNTLAKWNPFRELWTRCKIALEISSAVSKSNENGNGETLTLPDWSPQVDIIEDEKEYLVKADLPEMKKDDVSVVAEDGDRLGF